jgi:CelD/BcsL family acetyltransferase involved in cellulose biosynthesis
LILSYTFQIIEIDSLISLHLEEASHLVWQPLFVLPTWLAAWWRIFGRTQSPLLAVVRQDDRIIGIAPLKAKGSAASFMGDTAVADYLDFIVSPGFEKEFFSVLLDELKSRGTDRLDLAALRTDSATLNHLIPLAREHGCSISCFTEDITLELDLPASWPEYLAVLTTKQRHEVKRRLRRLNEVGNVSFHIATDSNDIEVGLDTLIRLMRLSRQDKNHFLDEPMLAFFKEMTAAMTTEGLLRLGSLELDGLVVATVLCFDYNNTVYLYNSGYDPRYGDLSVGLLCKVLCIKNSIEQSKKCFDFLTGAEVYKYRLGGREAELKRCRIDL